MYRNIEKVHLPRIARRKRKKTTRKMTRKKGLGSCRAAVVLNSLHPRVVISKFAADYLLLLPLPRDECLKGQCLLSSNRKGANGVTVGGRHTEFQLRCDRASIVGFHDNIWGLAL